MSSRAIFVLAVFMVLSTGSIADAGGAPPARASAANAWMETIQLLEHNGYSHGVIVQSVAVPGGWIGSAEKDNRRVEVAVDAKGKITERRRPAY